MGRLREVESVAFSWWRSESQCSLCFVVVLERRAAVVEQQLSRDSRGAEAEGFTVWCVLVGGGAVQFGGFATHSKSWATCFGPRREGWLRRRLAGPAAVCELADRLRKNMHGASRQLGIEAGRDRVAKVISGGCDARFSAPHAGMAPPRGGSSSTATSTASTVTAASTIVQRKHLQQDELSFMPAKKQQQQEEGGVMDEEEQKAFAERRRARIAGSSATARASVMPMSAHGRDYSARVQRPLSPMKAAKFHAQTARREEELRTRRENERAQRERARKAAQRAAARRDAEAAKERERREALRDARRQESEYNEEREKIAAEHAARHSVPALGFTVAPPTEKQIRRRKLRNRPEWGEDHAGGNRLQRKPSNFPAALAAAAYDDGDEEEEEAGVPPAVPTMASASSAVDVSDEPLWGGPDAAPPPAPPPAPPAFGGGLPMFKLDLPKGDEPEHPTFSQVQEWKWKKAEKPRPVQPHALLAAKAAEPDWRAPWKTPTPPQTLPVQLPTNGRLGSGMLAWLTGGGSEDSADDANDDEWHTATQSASAAELKRHLDEHVDDSSGALDVILIARDRCQEGLQKKSYEAAQVELCELGFAHAVVRAMRAHPTHEHLTFAGLELLALLANNYWGLEQRVFDAGALEVCLAACQQFGVIDSANHTRPATVVEEVLGAAYQAVHNIGHCEDLGDRHGCARKQKAVELGLLEVIAKGMNASNERWVQQAGKAAIGCLCKGIDKEGHARRQRAHKIFKLMARS